MRPRRPLFPFTRRLLLAALPTAMAAPAQQSSARKQRERFGLKHFVPEKAEEVAMLVYPGMTALDLVGPQQVFGFMGSANIRLVWKTRDAVASDTGIPIVATTTFG